MVDGWVKGFFHVCRLVKRLDRAEGDFLKDVAESEAVRMYVHKIEGHLTNNEAVCEQHKCAFGKLLGIHAALEAAFRRS